MDKLFNPSFQASLSLMAADPVYYAMTAGPVVKGRSRQWETFRKHYMSAHPNCEACGTRDNCEAHHIWAFEYYPELELVESNLIALCRTHHFVIGHFCDWHSYNPKVRDDAAVYLLHYDNRPHSRTVNKPLAV